MILIVEIKSKDNYCMNIIVNKDCLTFNDIEREIFKYVCQIAVDLTRELLAAYDKKLMMERDTSS